MIVGVQTLGRDGQQFGVRLTKQKLEVISQTIAESFKVSIYRFWQSRMGEIFR